MEKLKSIWSKLPLFWKDLGERVIRTFVASFGVIYLTGITAEGLDVTNLEGLIDWSLADKAATSGLLAAGSLVLGLLTKNVGDKNTASTFETPATTPPPYIAPETTDDEVVIPDDYVPYTGGPREFDH